MAQKAWNIYYMALYKKSFPSSKSLIILKCVKKLLEPIIKFTKVTKNNVNIKKISYFL